MAQHGAAFVGEQEEEQCAGNNSAQDCPKEKQRAQKQLCDSLGLVNLIHRQDSRSEREKALGRKKPFPCDFPPEHMINDVITRKSEEQK
jgi:hypothetical protein